MTPDDNCKWTKHSEAHKKPNSHTEETPKVVSKSEVSMVEEVSEEPVIEGGEGQPIQQVLVVKEGGLETIVTEVKELDDKAFIDTVEVED